MNGFGKKLIELRGKKSRREVAKACGISVSALGMYESERRVPRDYIKVRLAKYYKSTVETIFYTPKCHNSRQTEEFAINNQTVTR